MLSDIEKMIYCMVGKSSTEKDGCLVVKCNAATILSEKELLTKFLETISQYYRQEYKICEQTEAEEEIILSTNLPYNIYQTELGEFKSQIHDHFGSKA